MQTLPVDSLLPEITDALGVAPNLVIEAPPGAGKTTRVPPAILESGLAEDCEVWVLEPRRLAARLAARRVAEERGESLGETVGYQVRFEDVSGARTRLRFLTEGVFTRKILSDPNLNRVRALILDEFHERHLQGDLALALARRLQRTLRADLKIVVMSATLDAGPISQFLGDCTVLRSEGRLHSVEIEHLARPDERSLEEQVKSSVQRLTSEGLKGDVLVFLPGAAEIRRAQKACAELAAREDLLVLPLHGDLPAAEQDLAVRPCNRRKLILSTNVAESSITIEGVVAVIDSGLARVAAHSPWSGLPTLKIARISRASAEQRAGRAGRTRAGRCLRLYTAQDFAARPAHDSPEISRQDLAEPALELHASGVSDLGSFGWFEAPPHSALDAAESLLIKLGAVEAEGQVTTIGRRMLRFPLHPRLSRMIVEARARGVGSQACTVAALVGERDIRARTSFTETRAVTVAARHGSSDLIELSDLFEEAERAGFSNDAMRRMGLNAGAVRAAERVRRMLQRLLGKTDEKRSDSESELLISILAGYPDRVARRRESVTSDSKVMLALAGGGSAELSEESVVRRAEFMVAVEAEERREPGRSGTRGAGRVLVRLASAIEPEWLLDLFTDSLEETTVVEWDAKAERAVTVRRLTYEGLVLDESRSTTGGGAAASSVLAEALLGAGWEAFVDKDAIDSFLARCDLISRAAPELNFPALAYEDVTTSLIEMCEGRASFPEIREAVRAGELMERLRARLKPEQSALLDRWTPERLRLKGGRQLRVHYERGKQPWVASRLQDFFGMAEGLKVAGGRADVVLHLLAPNQRPVQVTTDLKSFWRQHYPQIRRELMRRYPRHAWPDDPLKFSS